MKIKLLQLLQVIALILAMTLVLTACRNGNTPDESISFPEISDYRTMSMPDGGWTGEEAGSVFYLHGKPIEIPFTIASLGDEYSINEDESSITEEHGVRGIMLNYKGHLMEYFSVGFLGKDVPTDFEQALYTEVSGINIHVRDEELSMYGNVLVFNGIRIGSSVDEVVAAFGETDKKTQHNESIIAVSYKRRYDDDKNCMGFWFNENGELDIFSVIFENKTQN